MASRLMPHVSSLKPESGGGMGFDSFPNSCSVRQPTDHRHLKAVSSCNGVDHQQNGNKSDGKKKDTKTRFCNTRPGTVTNGRPVESQKRRGRLETSQTKPYWQNLRDIRRNRSWNQRRSVPGTLSQRRPEVPRRPLGQDVGFTSEVDFSFTRCHYSVPSTIRHSALTSTHRFPRGVAKPLRVPGEQ